MNDSILKKAEDYEFLTGHENERMQGYSTMNIMDDESAIWFKVV